MTLRIERLWWTTDCDGPAYQTPKGRAFQYCVEEFLKSRPGKALRGKVDLVLTSPPFPLLRPKKYGNETGEGYLRWLKGLAGPLGDLLSPTGSLVIEIGNAWLRGIPEMSTLPIETLIAVRDGGDFHVCQQFICHNPARLPGPAEWVTVRRTRVKDSYTHVWWYSRTVTPKADNRSVLLPYSAAMERLIERKSYNAGRRPSEHDIKPQSFLRDNGGSIPPSALVFSGTPSQRQYQAWCKEIQVRAHPARMQARLAEFFIRFLTKPGDLVVDPFGGSNTTGWAAESLGRRWLAVEPDVDYLVGSLGRFATTEQIDAAVERARQR